MMDDEKHKNEYNELRNECLCRNGSSCKMVIGRDCKPDKYLECPLFTFIKKMRKHG